ncbi:MAG TPA: AI-2E family transporter [Candidatus Limnocylindrales bacterium]|nr:AI-2E family transporter [Candidatus Limnocylindrales bacterium]
MTRVGAIASDGLPADAVTAVATDIQTAPAADARAARKAYATRRWADVRDGITTTTPQAVGRGLLAVAVVGGSLWLAVATWPTLLPFLVGGLIAYTLLPVVDALDQVMPRPLAAGLSVLGVLAAVVAVGVIVGPPLIGAFARLSGDLPTAADIDAALERAREQLAALPRARPMRSCRSWPRSPSLPAMSWLASPSGPTR